MNTNTIFVEDKPLNSALNCKCTCGIVRPKEMQESVLGNFVKIVCLTCEDEEVEGWNGGEFHWFFHEHWNLPAINFFLSTGN